MKNKKIHNIMHAAVFIALTIAPFSHAKSIDQNFELPIKSTAKKKSDELSTGAKIGIGIAAAAAGAALLAGGAAATNYYLKNKEPNVPTIPLRTHQSTTKLVPLQEYNKSEALFQDVFGARPSGQSSNLDAFIKAYDV